MIEYDLATSVPSLSGTLPRRHRHDGGPNTSVATAATSTSFALAMNEVKEAYAAQAMATGQAGCHSGALRAFGRDRSTSGTR
jgi:hypothetical protein